MSTALQSDKELKTAIRAEAMAKRDALTLEQRSAKGQSIARGLSELAEFKAAGSVLLYAAFRSEVPTDETTWMALGMNKHVLVPKVDETNKSLSKHPIRCLSELKEGYQGIPEPKTDVCWQVEDIELIVVPGVAFDTQGHRVGYGGGYYDRLLPRVKGTRAIVALAFEEQVFDHVPHEDHDIAMDIIVTDKRIIDCRD